MNRPEFPRGCHPDSKVWKDYQKAMEAYLAEHRWDYLDGIPKTQPEPQAMNQRMLTAPRKAANAPKKRLDPEYYAEAKRKQRERDKTAPRACMDCGVEPRLPRKARCFNCDDIAKDRQQMEKQARRNLIRQGLTARSRGERMEER